LTGVTLEDAVGTSQFRRALGLDFLSGLSKRQSLGLSEDVRQEHVMVPAKRIQSFAERDEVAGNQPGP